MAVADNVFLISKYITTLFKIYKVNVYNFCILYTIVPRSASLISIWLILIITAERTCCLVWPFKVYQIFSKKNSRLFIAFTIIFFLCITTSAGLCLEYYKPKPYICSIKTTHLFYKIYYNTIYQSFEILFGAWLPSLIGFCLNIIFVIYLVKMIAKQPARSERSTVNNEKQLAIMILTISITFFILTVPYSIYELMVRLLDSKTFNYYIPNKNRRKNIEKATLLLVDLNHSTNFFVYVLTTKRFRNELKNILFFWKKKKDTLLLVKYKSVKK